VVRTETERLTTTEGAVLALLAIEGERSGYDLQKLVAKAIAHVWSPARSGLYASLPRLVRDGLASARTAAGARGAEKQLYAITDAGRAALDDWLATVEPGARETFFLKLFVGGLATDDVLLDHVEQFTADTEDQLGRLRAIEPTNTGEGHDRYHRFLLELGIARAEQELLWAAGVEASLRS
jgi:DNA-binding PadR family transcriptional regulator